MINIVVVDDEKYAVNAVARGIDWSDLKISNVYEAYCAFDAMELFKIHSIDVMVCDIEMPGKTGIQLLKWVKENYPMTETVFLTGHASFEYAQQSVQLGGFDYLLKPVDYDELKKIVQKAINKVKKNMEVSQFYDTYRVYYKHWEKHIPILVERLWQDVLSERIFPSDKRLESFFNLYGVPLITDSLVLPIIANVEEWKVKLDTKDEDIMEFALRNIAEELFFKDYQGVVIQDHDGNNVILIYCMNNEHSKDDILKKICMEFIKACNNHLKCSISCYVGEPTAIEQLVQNFKILLEIESTNISSFNSVIFKSEYKISQIENYHIPSSADWILLMEVGKKEQLINKIEIALKSIVNQQLTYEIFETYYYSLLNAVFVVLHKKSLSVRKVFFEKEALISGVCPRSIIQFTEWAYSVIVTTIDFMDETGSNVSAIINKLQRYILEHINEDFSREDLASYVYLNSAYLSRVFKKETGSSLTDYILNIRIEKSKELLSKTNQKISDISDTFGYTSYTHFTKMFKKVVGISPQEYRRKFFNT